MQHEIAISITHRGDVIQLTSALMIWAIFVSWLSSLTYASMS